MQRLEVSAWLYPQKGKTSTVTFWKQRLITFAAACRQRHLRSTKETFGPVILFPRPGAFPLLNSLWLGSPGICVNSLTLADILYSLSKKIALWLVQNRPLPANRTAVRTPWYARYPELRKRQGGI